MALRQNKKSNQNKTKRDKKKKKKKSNQRKTKNDKKKKKKLTEAQTATGKRTVCVTVRTQPIQDAKCNH